MLRSMKNLTLRYQWVNRHKLEIQDFKTSCAKLENELGESNSQIEALNNASAKTSDGRAELMKAVSLVKAHKNALNEKSAELDALKTDYSRLKAKAVSYKSKLRVRESEPSFCNFFFGGSHAFVVCSFFFCVHASLV